MAVFTVAWPWPRCHDAHVSAAAWLLCDTAVACRVLLYGECNAVGVAGERVTLRCAKPGGRGAWCAQQPSTCCTTHTSAALLTLCPPRAVQITYGMAKHKNHTAHNQTRKNHRNGIKRPKKQRYSSLLGVDPKFLRNARYAKKNTVNTVKA